MIEDALIQSLLNGTAQGGALVLVVYFGMKFVAQKLDKIEAEVSEMKGIMSQKCKKEN